MSEAGYEKVIGGDHVFAEPDAYTRLDYARDQQPTRDNGWEGVGSLLCAFGIVFGILALIHPFMPDKTIAFPSLKYGLIGIALSVIGLSIGGMRDLMGRYALTIATLGWLLGTMLCIVFNKSAY